MSETAKIMKYGIAVAGFVFCAAAVLTVFGVVGFVTAAIMRITSHEVPTLFWPIIWLAGLACGLPAGVHSFRATLRRYRTDK